MLPKSTISCKIPNYNFGLDPINYVYKLLKICPIYKDENEGTNDLFVRNFSWEILTISIDSSWRHINPTPQESIIDRNICITNVLNGLHSIKANGSLHIKTCTIIKINKNLLKKRIGALSIYKRYIYYQIDR